MKTGKSAKLLVVFMNLKCTKKYWNCLDYSVKASSSVIIIGKFF